MGKPLLNKPGGVVIWPPKIHQNREVIQARALVVVTGDTLLFYGALEIGGLRNPAGRL